MNTVAVMDEVTDAKWKALQNVVHRRGPFAPEAFQEGEECWRLVREDAAVLVVGAGGLGCEVLKDLALSGFRDVHVIDLDTIELSNLNRQFLFRAEDVGRFKAQVAAEFIMRRCPGIKVTPYTQRLEKFDKDFYRQFNIVIAGLDSVNARRWLNAMLVSLVEFDQEGNIDVDTVIPFIDGGTEGWKGQARLFLPRITSCYECSIETLPKQREFASCTIANVPRLPEHCVAYARKILWPKLISFQSHNEFELDQERKFADEDDCIVPLDTDNVEHMTWLYQRSLDRANEFNIKGVTYNLTMQVVKNIIPAIAATNALISAACVNEAFKALTWCSKSLNNFFMYMGHTGVYSNTFSYERKPDCIVCNSRPMKFSIDPSAPLNHLIQLLLENPTLKLQAPSLSVQSKVIYIGSGILADSYQGNLEKSVDTFLNSGDTVILTDRSVLGEIPVYLEMHWEEGKFWVPSEEQ